MYETYVPGFSNYLQRFAEGGQALPTEQPVAAQAAPAYPDMPADYAQRAAENARRAYDLAAQKSFGARGELSKGLDRIDTSSDFNYSPTAAQYLYDVGRYPTENTEYELSPMNLMKVDPQTGAPMPYTSGQLEQYAQQPLADQFYANFAYGGPGSEWDVGALQFAPNQQYRLIDRSTGDVVYSGTGYEAGKNISQMAKGVFDKSGQQANWLVQEAAPGSDQWTQRYEHTPPVNGFTTWLKMVAPMAGGVLAAPLGLGGTLGAAAGSAAGSAGAGALAGDSFGDILKGAALSGLSSYAAGELLGGLGGSKAPPGTPPAGGSLAGANPVASGGSLTGAFPGDIVAIGSKAALAAPALAAGIGGTLGGALNAASTKPSTGQNNYGDQLWGVQPDAPITVVGNPSNPGAGTIPGVTASGALAGALSGGTQAPPAQQPTDPEIVVEASRNQPLVTGPGLSLGDIATLPLDTTLAQPMNPNPQMQDIPPTPGLSVADAIKKGLSVADYMQLAGLGVGALGSLFGGRGNNSQTAGRWPGGSTPNPTLNASLPTANIPGLTGAAGGPRTAAELGAQGLNTKQDWYRYGYGPQQSFFKYVPQAQPNTSQAYTGYAEGGSVVEGPGDGREDKIPAMLSDGEYVMDAETVALLGNGSNKAGADLLDQFRVNIRKHKGRELARGGFSEDAMRPEYYLAGGSA